jgi:hypothetical protein
MLCPVCGYANTPSRSACQRCLSSFDGGSGDGFAQTMVLEKVQQRPRREYTAEALEVLRTGSPEDKIAAREYLAGIFEGRGMIPETIDLLVENARQGVRTPELFERLAALYRGLGQHEYADMALAEVRKLTPPPPAPEVWNGHGPVALHPLDRPPAGEPRHPAPPPPPPIDAAEALLATTRTFREQAADACQRTSREPASAPLAAAIDALIDRGQALLTDLQQPDVSVKSLLASRGAVKGMLAWSRVDRARGQVAESLHLLRKARYGLGLALGDDAYVEDALGQMLARLAPGATLAVVNGRAQIAVAAPANTIPRYTLTPARGNRAPVRKERPLRDVNREYKDVLAEHARKIALSGFAAATGLRAISLAIMAMIDDPMTGHRVSVCWLAFEVDRHTFTRILHNKVEPENALRNGSLRFDYGARDFELRPVQPFAAPSPAPSRQPAPARYALPQQQNFIGSDVLDLDVGEADAFDLDSIDPLDFEELVRMLLERMGFEARLTKASHDGGIDIVAINPAPITGGKVIVQCKRYRATIGSPVVRDLYGALTDAGASKAILITTSRFSPDARKFAQGKPIDLIDRTQLEDLLRQYMA